MKTTILYAVLISTCIGCSFMHQAPTSITYQNKCTIEIPYGFEEEEHLKEGAILAFNNTKKNTILIVTAQNIDNSYPEWIKKISSNQDMANIKKSYFKSLAKNVKKTLSSYLADTLKSRAPKKSIINNLNAFTGSFKATDKKKRDVYVNFGVLEGKEDYYTVFSITVGGIKNQYKEDVMTSIGSFSEL